MTDSRLQDKILDLTGGLLITLSDVMLYSIILFGSSFGKSNSSRGVYQTFREADSEFEKFNTRVIISSLKRLKCQKKYLDLVKHHDKWNLMISDEGKKHIKDIIPAYRNKRLWDGKFYLINYDIPEKHRKVRNIIRNRLKNIGAGLLQNSLWLTPYDPKREFADIFENFGANSWFIISETDLDGIYPYSRNKMDELLDTVYKFQELRKKYEKFILRNNTGNRLLKAFEYLNILKDDPQLPFEIEPKNLKAKEAYELYRRLIKR
jgi:DNA-binding transcriptional regulator PaaX